MNSPEPKKPIVPPLKVGTKVKLLRSTMGYTTSSLDVPKSITLDINEELKIMSVMDTRYTPDRKAEPLAAEAQHSLYKVCVVKEVTEHYKDKPIHKVKHMDLTTARNGEGAHPLVAFKINEKAFLRVAHSGYAKGTEVFVKVIGSTSGPGGNPSGLTAGTSGRVTTATPVTKLVYDVDVYVTKKTKVEYLPSGYMHHNLFRAA